MELRLNGQTERRVFTTDAQIRHWPIIGRPIIGA